MNKDIAKYAIPEDFQQDQVAAEKLPKRPLRGTQHRWASRRNAESENYQRFRWGSSKLKFAGSPFIPKSLKEFLKHKEEYSKDQVARYRVIIAKRDSQAPKVGVECMGGKTFETSEGAVLAMPTIWSSWYLTVAQIKTSWPSNAELTEEGHERVLQGYHRRFPNPRTIEFRADTLLPYPGYYNQLGQEYASWNDEEKFPYQEQQFALALNHLDLVGEMWRENDDEEASDGPEEFEAEAEADLLGRELLGMLSFVVVSCAEGDEEPIEGCLGKIDEGAERVLERGESCEKIDERKDV
jgi:hypothetical protein